MSTHNSASVDSTVRRRAVRLADLRRVVPRDLMHPSRGRSWLALGRVCATATLILFLVSRVLVPLEEMTPVRWALLTALWMAQGLTLVGLFVIGHDCGHDSFSPSKTVNAVVGYLVMSPLINGFHTWRVTHNHHHAFTQLRGQEVDWASHLRTRDELRRLSWRDAPLVRLGYALPFGVFLWVGWNTLRRSAMVRQLVGDKAYARERRQLLLSNALMFCLQGLLGITLVQLAGWWGLAAYHLIPALLAGTFGAFIIAVGHANEESLLFEQDTWSPARGQISSTYNIRFPRWMEWMICDINIHVPHHVSVRIPWYNLRAANDAIKAAYPDLVQEHALGWSDVSWCVRAPVLEWSDTEGYYTLSPLSPD